jgi:hypothetical protein
MVLRQLSGWWGVIGDVWLINRWTAPWPTLGVTVLFGVSKPKGVPFDQLRTARSGR